MDAIETVMYFNILTIAAFTWYTLDTGKSQAAITYISIIITSALLLAVIAFHVYKYTGLCSIIQKSQIYTQMKAKMQVNEKKQKKADIDDYVPQFDENQQEPTYTLVEIHNPHL